MFKLYYFKNNVFNIIAGILLVAFAIAAMFFLGILSDFVNIVVAAIIILYSVTRYLKDKTLYKNNNALMILTVEVIVVITLSVLLILEQLGLAFVIGLTLYIRGLTYLLILQLLSLKSTFQVFVIYLAVMTLGTYILFANPRFGELFEWVLFIFMLAYGVFLIALGSNKKIKQKVK
ncbi:MAG: hypothetical protein ACNA7U_08030 [Candidatus Izemoplasmataceae bacterium]|jgi:hypothetical protein|uniref:hypothetical protein n=1 Tax=Liberiplasma polymorphum TaxID=3374570 RepID=UPI003773EDD5